MSAVNQNYLRTNMSEQVYVDVKDLPGRLDHALGALNPSDSTFYSFDLAFLILMVRGVQGGIYRASWPKDMRLGFSFGKLTMLRDDRVDHDFRLPADDLRATDWIINF